MCCRVLVLTAWVLDTVLVKVKVWTLAIAPLTWVRLVTSSALQSRKWQLIGMSQRCCNTVGSCALCGHPLTTLNGGNGDLQTLICVLVARPRRCLTLSNHVPWRNWMAAYLGYTLWMKTLFYGWPVMVHDMHTRRRPTLTEIGPTVQLADTPSPKSATLGLHPIAITTTHVPSRWG